MSSAVSSTEMKQFFLQQQELGMPDYIFAEKKTATEPIVPQNEEKIEKETLPAEPIKVEIKKETSKEPAVDENLIYEEKRKALIELFYEMKNCRGCQLCSTRNKIVFGAGNAGAKITILGEGPGQEEDTTGLPFVGKAGKLLDKMVGAINLDRADDLFIANVVKCRPPGNRNPESAEINACMPILKRQIFIIKPKIILALGKVAIKELLGSENSISSLRQKNGEYFYNDIPLIVTYHPAALLRNEQYKRPAWEDLQKLQQLMKEMNINGTATSSKSK